MNAVRKVLRVLGLARPEPVAVHVTFYTREGCTLCDEAQRLLAASVARRGRVAIEMDLRNIDGDAELVSRYGDKVPVLVIGGRERLWGKINPVLLRRTLEAEGERLLRERQANGGSHSES
jgi:glutaredoxin